MTYQELKDRAKELGVEFKGQPAKEELEVLVAEAEEAQAMAAKEAGYEKPTEESKAAVKTEISEVAAKVNARQEALKLSYVKITPLDERMRGLPSETYSVGNGEIGFIKKVVVFNKPSWEPACILQLFAEKSMLIQESATVNGQEIVRNIEVPAFAVVEVPVPAEMQAQLDASKK